MKPFLDAWAIDEERRTLVPRILARAAASGGAPARVARLDSDEDDSGDSDADVVQKLNERERKGERAAWRTRGGRKANARRWRGKRERKGERAAWRTCGGRKANARRVANAQRRRSVRGRRDRCIFSSALNG